MLSRYFLGFVGAALTMAFVWGVLGAKGIIGGVVGIIGMGVMEAMQRAERRRVGYETTGDKAP